MTAPRVVDGDKLLADIEERLMYHYAADTLTEFDKGAITALGAVRNDIKNGKYTMPLPSPLAPLEAAGALRQAAVRCTEVGA